MTNPLAPPAVSDEVALAVAPYIRWVNTIAEALKEQAEDRDWCSEYDQFVDDVNRQIPSGVAHTCRLRKSVRHHDVKFYAYMSVDDAGDLELAIDAWLDARGLSCCDDFEVSA